MEATSRSVERLTEDHTEWEDGKAVERSPLLIELAESATAQSRGSGAGGAGVPINLGVIELQDHIRAKLKLMREALLMEPEKDLIVSTKQVWVKASDERTGGRMDDAAWGRYGAEFPDWVRRITEEVSPPASTEMITECPECGERRAFLRGDTVAAVIVKWYPDELHRAPHAKCRFCGHEWTGWGAMNLDLKLVNVDVLATLGVDLNNFGIKSLLL